MRDAIGRCLERAGGPADPNLPEIQREYARAAIEPVATRAAPGGNAPLVLSVLRNEIDIVGDFLRHYRKAGIERFVMLDNGSDDGTFEYLARQHDVDLYRTGAAFTTLKKQAWINILLDTYHREGTWFIYADADEQIVFDGLDAGRSFRDLAAAMDRAGIRRVRGCLVDMYSQNPFAPASYRRGDALVESRPFFDKTGYREYALPPLIAREGGPRQRLFSTPSGDFRPQLTKYPMFRLDPGDVFVDPHFLWPYEKNFVSACFLGILHFKFLPDFSLKVDRTIEERTHWQSSFEYRCYKSALSAKDHLTFINGNTELYKGPESLVQNNLISSVTW